MKLAHLLHRHDGPTLRERLNATTGRLADVRDRAALAMKVGRVTFRAPEPAPEPSNRVALINYATWLWHERRRVCTELYPHLGIRAHAFVLGLNAAEDWHFDGRDRSGGWSEKPSATPRAIQILDTVGVDWRADIPGGLTHVDGPHRHDTGERPKLPHGWPAPDAALLEALDDLTRLDAAQAAMSIGTDREADEVPGYDALEEARNNALARLAKVKAESLTGLQAKARSLLMRSVSDMGGADFENIAQSLARDLVGAPQTTIEPRPDPIFAAITECERLEAIAHANEVETPPGDELSLDAKDDASAVWTFIENTLLNTVPTTAAGCGALARFVPPLFKRWGASLDGHQGAGFFNLIARSPLL